MKWIAAAIVVIGLAYVFWSRPSESDRAEKAVSRASSTTSNSAKLSYDDVKAAVTAKPRIIPANRGPASVNENGEPGPPDLLNIRAAVLSAACILRELNLSITNIRNTKYYANLMNRSDFPTKAGEPKLKGKNLTALIKSPNCPDETYSFVSANEIDGKWEVEKVIDCQSADKADLYRAFRVSNALEYVGDEKPNEKALAITGPGHFLLRCRTGYVATRSGAFFQDSHGGLHNEEGCALMTKDLTPAAKANDAAFIDIHSSDIASADLQKPGYLGVTFAEETKIPFEVSKDTEINEGYREMTSDNDGMGMPVGLFQDLNLDEDCANLSVRAGETSWNSD